MTYELSNDDKKLLLTTARQAVLHRLAGKPYNHLNQDVPEPLKKHGASFVTLTKYEALRGCIGTLKAYQPLVQDVCEHAVAAAFEDYRFSAVTEQELPSLRFEISVLTEPVPLDYSGSVDLLSKIRKGIDGVTLKDGFRQATFLPQVWEQLPQSEEFLSHLCQKMGSRADTWRTKHLEVETYQVIHFSENDNFEGKS